MSGKTQPSSRTYNSPVENCKGDASFKALDELTEEPLPGIPLNIVHPGAESPRSHKADNNGEVWFRGKRKYLCYDLKKPDLPFGVLARTGWGDT